MGKPPGHSKIGKGFMKSKKAIIADIDAQIAKLDKQQKEVAAEIETKILPLQTKVSRLRNKIAALMTKKDRLILASKRVDWAWLLETYPESNVKYEARRKEFRKLGLMDPFGHWNDTKQTAVKIGLNKHESSSNYWKNDRQLKGVKKLLPFIKYGDKGCKKIDIFEHTLSINGNHWLEFYKGGRIQLSRTYGEPVKFKTIEDAFKYVSQNLWYESSDPADNRDHDYDTD